jgi:hypothetical protein
MFPDDLEPERWQRKVDQSVWLYLAKLQESGTQLGDTTLQRLNKLSQANPEWRLSSDERDEFSHWMSGTGDPDFEERRDVNFAPRKRAEMVLWLRQSPPERRPFYEDNWLETCRTRFFHVLSALCDLARENLWPVEPWRTALQAWSEEGRVQRSWRYASPLVRNMPNEVMQENVHALAWWLHAASKVIDRNEVILLKLCQRVLALPLESSARIRRNGEPIRDPISEAINH